MKAMKYILTFGMAVMATLLATQVCAQNILVNGSFESPNLTGTSPNGQGFIALTINPGSTNLTGWTVSNYVPALIKGQWYSAYPEDGNQFIVLSPGDQPSGTVIAQTFSTTPGFSYSVLYWQAQSGATIQVHQILSQVGSSTGAILGSLQTSPAMAINDWEMHNYIFTASTTNSTLSFTETIAGNNSDQALDNISVTEITPLTHTAIATASVVNGFVVGTTLADDGYGYTNTPLVRFIGGGGSGASATAVVSNGLVTVVNILNPGSGYTNAPLIIIAPPYILNPILSIAPMTFLVFSNLMVGSNYQLQLSEGYYWSNQPVSFTATNALYTQIITGVVNSGDYRLVLSLVPAQAFATAQVVNGFVVVITLTSGGSGYVTNPAVTIVGNGSNATAVALISSGGVVTNITLTDPGIGYTDGATVEFAQPPTIAVSPTGMPMVQLNSTSLAPYDNYQFQFTPVIGATWENWNGGLFIPTTVTNEQLFFFTNGTGFFRLQYLP